MAEWKRLIIDWPTDQSYPPVAPRDSSMARKLLAVVADRHADNPRCALPPAVFHRTKNADGTLRGIDGISPIRIAARPGGIMITAVGDDAVDLLEAVGHRVTRMFSAEAGQPLREHFSGGMMHLSASKTLRCYLIPYCVVSRHPAKALADGDAITKSDLTPSLKSWLERKISDSLVRQAALVRLPEPDEPLIDVTSVGGFGGWNRDGAFFGIVAHDLVFRADLHLMGPWNVGHLSSLNAGAVYPQTDRIKREPAG